MNISPLTTTLDDSEKLRVLAAWFDLWDSTRYEDRQRLLNDSKNPGKNEVQRDLRRIADRLAAQPPPLAEALRLLHDAEALLNQPLGKSRHELADRIRRYLAATEEDNDAT